MAVALVGAPIAPLPMTANTAGQRELVIDHAVAGQYDLNAAGVQIPIGSWVVITDTVTGASDKAFVIATTMTGTQTSLTLSTNLVNSYAAGTTLVDINTDQNRDGIVTGAERVSIRRHLRNNYSIAFVGSITENHSATSVYSTHRTLTTVGTALGASAVTVNGIADAVPGGIIIVGSGTTAEERIIAGVQRHYYNTVAGPLAGTRTTDIAFTTPLITIHGPNEPVVVATRGEAREWTDKWLYPTNFAAPVSVGTWSGIRYFYDIGLDPLVGASNIPPFLPASPDLIESAG
jgi:hypothetical protein